MVYAYLLQFFNEIDAKLSEYYCSTSDYSFNYDGLYVYVTFP